ncbi:MAG: hypothetical protein LBI57_05070 [Helicobacteraceae bacterium]|jgi:hypothetical protein|nr:hypothetical protein [Helicobacteraceae bacterium]
MSSLSFFDPVKIALDFLAIQADAMRGRKLEIGFVRSNEKLKVAKLLVNKEEKKAFYAAEENSPLQELTPEKLTTIGGVKII